LSGGHGRGKNKQNGPKAKKKHLERPRPRHSDKNAFEEYGGRTTKDQFKQSRTQKAKESQTEE